MRPWEAATDHGTPSHTARWQPRANGGVCCGVCCAGLEATHAAHDRFPWAFETFRYSASQSLCWSLLEEGRPVTNARSPLPSKAVAERNLLPQPQEPISTSMAPHVLKKLRQRKAGARASSATYGT